MSFYIHYFISENRDNFEEMYTRATCRPAAYLKHLFHLYISNPRMKALHPSGTTGRMNVMYASHSYKVSQACTGCQQ